MFLENFKTFKSVAAALLCSLEINNFFTWPLLKIPGAGLGSGSETYHSLSKTQNTFSKVITVLRNCLLLNTSSVLP
jgi:hypothetical protein